MQDQNALCLSHPLFHGGKFDANGKKSLVAANLSAKIAEYTVICE